MEGQGRWSFLKHPLVLAGVPAITAIVVAVITVSSQSDGETAEPRSTAGKATQSQNDIAFRIGTDFEAYEEGWEAAFDGPLPGTEQYPRKHGEYESKLRWAKTRGAVDIGQSNLRLFLQNDGSERVTVRAIRAIVTERLERMSETLLKAPSAGVNELIHLGFDLDSGDSVPAVEVKPDPSTPTAGKESFFSTRNVTLVPGETIDVRLKVTAQRCLCRYRFEVEMVKADSVIKLEVGDAGGRPFAITGPAQSYAGRWMDGGLACNKLGVFKADATEDVDCTQAG